MNALLSFGVAVIIVVIEQFLLSSSLHSHNFKYTLLKNCLFKSCKNYTLLRDDQMDFWYMFIYINVSLDRRQLQPDFVENGSALSAECCIRHQRDMRWHSSFGHLVNWLSDALCASRFNWIISRAGHSMCHIRTQWKAKFVAQTHAQKVKELESHEYHYISLELGFSHSSLTWCDAAMMYLCHTHKIEVTHLLNHRNLIENHKLETMTEWKYTCIASLWWIVTMNMISSGALPQQPRELPTI